MKALLDTNIIIHREASKIINQDIGILYRWLERANYIKCVHLLSISEIEKYQDKEIVDVFHVKLDSYEKIEIGFSPTIESKSRLRRNRRQPK